jgi:hypothetical protein
MYDIIGVSQYGREVIDTAESLRDALYMVGEYRLAFGPGWTITYRKVHKS